MTARQTTSRNPTSARLCLAIPTVPARLVRSALRSAIVPRGPSELRYAALWMTLGVREVRSANFRFTSLVRSLNSSLAPYPSSASLDTRIECDAPVHLPTSCRQRCPSRCPSTVEASRYREVGDIQEIEVRSLRRVGRLDCSRDCSVLVHTSHAFWNAQNPAAEPARILTHTWCTL
jgi:hypothetical protein